MENHNENVFGCQQTTSDSSPFEALGHQHKATIPPELLDQMSQIRYWADCANGSTESQPRKKSWLDREPPAWLKFPFLVLSSMIGMALGFGLLWVAFSLLGH